MTLPPEVPVVLAASASWDTPAPVNAHHVARRLAARGHRVLFVESVGLRPPSPLASRHDLRRVLARARGFARGVREVAPRLHVLSPVVPVAGPPALRALALGAVARSAGRASRKLGFERPVLWAFLPTALPLADRLAPRALVYHCVDHYAANPGVDAAWVDGLERRMLARADVVFATSAVLAERLRPLAAAPVTLVPNVADVALFARAHEALPEPPELRGLPRPRAVYVGNLAAYRVDFELLADLARSRVGSLVLVGPVGLGEASGTPAAARNLLALPNVAALGPRAPEALPALLRHCDVALVPFLDNPHTRASFPLKVWEYLAAGLPVVATPLPGLRELGADGTLRLAGRADFAGAVRAAAEEPAARRGERLALARAHDWPGRIEELCAVVGEATARRGADGAGPGSGRSLP